MHEGELLLELKILRRGAGLAAADLVDRVGPALRAVCNVVGRDGLTTVRQKVTSRLTELISQLPADQRQVARTALNLHGGRPQVELGDRYTDRLRQLAEEIDRDLRTVQRRADEALGHLAEVVVVAMSQPVDTDWYVERMRLALLLDNQAPQVFESRRIVAASPLDRVELLVSADARSNFRDYAIDHSHLDIDVLYGGRLVASDIGAHDTLPNESEDDTFVIDRENQVILELELPIRVMPGQTHEFGLLYNFRKGSVRDHYLFVPTRRCDELEMRVQFDTSKAPDTVQRVANAFPLAPDAKPSGAHAEFENLKIDRRGQVVTTFYNLKPEFAYGLLWPPPEEITYSITMH